MSSMIPERKSDPRRLIEMSWLILAGLLTAAVLVGLVSATRAQDRRPSGNLGPELVAGLEATKGCLGVETADTGSGKSVIFAWFENRKACLRWYYSDLHQAMMEMVFTDEARRDHGRKGRPLADIPSSYDGPILAIASLTFSGEAGGLDQINMPISQIAIELYRPLSGGLNIGGRFAPEGLVVPKAEGPDATVGDY